MSKRASERASTRKYIVQGGVGGDGGCAGSTLEELLPDRVAESIRMAAWPAGQRWPKRVQGYGIGSALSRLERPLACFSSLP